MNHSSLATMVKKTSATDFTSFGKKVDVGMKSLHHKSPAAAQTAKKAVAGGRNFAL